MPAFAEGGQLELWSLKAFHVGSKLLYPDLPPNNTGVATKGQGNQLLHLTKFRDPGVGTRTAQNCANDTM